MSVRPLRPDTDRCLGEPLPHQLANQARAPLQVPGLAIPSFDLHLFKGRMSCGISVPFGTLSPALGKISYVLLTRTPRYRGRIPFASDLHVLGPPLTFALSQDQTLQLILGNQVFGVEAEEVAAYCERDPRPFFVFSLASPIRESPVSNEGGRRAKRRHDIELVTRTR